MTEVHLRDRRVTDKPTGAAARRLPQSYDIHWSPERKAEVVRAVRDKLISFDEARWRYLLSKSEFRGWQRDLEKRGEPGMKFEPV